MLLEFKAANYKSFRDELDFFLIPAPKQKGLDYSILKEEIGSKTYKGLCSSVIYGPNASGKTNIIGAMDVCKLIILRGHIRNADNQNTANVAANALEFIPNNTNEENRPVKFSLKFIEKGILFEYHISLDVGGFLEAEYSRSIVSEILFINEKLVFSRNGDELEIDDLQVIAEYLVKGFEDNNQDFHQGLTILARSNLNREELFLTNGFKAMFSAQIAHIITNWLDKKFTVIYRADSIRVIRKSPDNKKKSKYIDKTMNDAARIFGINSNALGYIADDENAEVKLYSIFADQKAVVPAEVFESYGTIRFVNMFPLVVNALLSGGTLVVDEFDASIHPTALMSIVNMFHNNEINSRNAQLIFNTHNPIFLNANLFRRDEIKFVERDDQTNISYHYSLSDFGTSGEKSVRKHADYMKNYFVSKYGAIKDIDFTSILEQIMNGLKEV